MLVTSNAGGGAAGAAAGSDTQVIFNNAGSYAGDAGLVYTAASDYLQVGSSLAIGHTSEALPTSGVIRVAPTGAGLVSLITQRVGGVDYSIFGNRKDASWLDIGHNSFTLSVRSAGTAYIVGVAGGSPSHIFYLNGTSLFQIGKLATDFLGLGVTPSTTGHIRGPSDFTLKARNAANGADLPLVTLASDALVLGGTSVNGIITRTNGGFNVEDAGGTVNNFVVSNSIIESGLPRVGCVGRSVPYGTDGVGIQAMADANQTPAAAVYINGTIKTTGAITANRNLTLPAATDAAAYFKWINNTCTGAFGIVVKDSGAGTTITVANGKTACILMDSRGATRLTADV